ncbi:transglutaminase-like domain-containing protein [Streptomyces lateritius]|uniref:transglutaminase-like domain-containing protein n=1 Tax=Streptomyces lateritius TaxID=67313 RepID=UPI001677EEA8|nr:transglutaminase family protein [Streptomyces lateritius]GGT93534.1 transglutaminase [Streptomyces lateritius]
MELIQQEPELASYLAADGVIDHEHPLVRQTAAHLRADHPDAYSYAEAAFEFVRDAISHSFDSGDMRVTWRASDVLAQGTGICYAKSHALAALLRAEGVPTALCYQRLGADDGSDPVVHGLIALRLPGESGWARQDPRGNKPGVDARFSLEGERLAWPVRPECNEVDYPVLYAAPHPKVLKALWSARDRPELSRTLPTAL